MGQILCLNLMLDAQEIYMTVQDTNRGLLSHLLEIPHVPVNHIQFYRIILEDCGKVPSIKVTFSKTTVRTLTSVCLS